MAPSPSGSTARSSPAISWSVTATSSVPWPLAGGLRAGDPDRQHPLARRDEDAGERGPARLAAAAARPGGVVVVGHRVVARIQAAVEQRVAEVDARVEHGDRGAAERGRGVRRAEAADAGGLRRRRIEAAHGLRAHAQRRELGEVARADRGREAVERAGEGAHVRQPDAARGEGGAERGALVLERLPRRCAAPRGRGCRPRRATGAGGGRSRGCRRRSAPAASARRRASRRRRSPRRRRPRRPPSATRRARRRPWRARLRGPGGQALCPLAPARCPDLALPRGFARPGTGGQALRPRRGRSGRRTRRGRVRPRAGGGRRWRRRPARGSRGTGAGRRSGPRRRSSPRCPCRARAAAP